MPHALDRTFRIVKPPIGFPNWSLADRSYVLGVMYDFFTPRKHWSTKAVAQSDSLAELNVLADCWGRGEINLCFESIESLTFNQKSSWNLDPGKQSDRLLLPALNRRGQELQDLTWSAGAHMIKHHQIDQIEPFWDGLPYAYVHPKTRTLMTAGNIDCARLLQFALEHQCSHLGNVFPVESMQTHGTDSAAGCLQMNWLKLSPKGSGLIKAHFERLDKCASQILSAFAKEMESFDDPWSS